MTIRTTHTYAELEVSAETYIEIAKKLRTAGYDHAFIETGSKVSKTIDMHGIGLVVSAEEAARVRRNQEETEIEGAEYLDDTCVYTGIGEPRLASMVIVVSGPDEDDEIKLLDGGENYLPRATAIALVEELCRRLRITVMSNGKAVQHE